MFELGAVDLGYVGARFTWCNKRWGRGSIKERLDRGIANVEWRTKFPRATVLHLGVLDHFHFEAMWAEDARCYDLRKWNKEVFGHVQARIVEFSRNIEKIQLEDPTKGNVMEEAKLQAGMNSWLSRNELTWRQKSRETWLKDGDRNSKFFHISTVVRRRRNSIDAIRGDDSEWIVKVLEIREFVVGKFQEMFTAEEIASNELEDIIAPSITVEENSLLCQVSTPIEIKNVLFGMQSMKSLDSNGLPPLFYKKYWKVVGHSVIKVVCNFFISGKMLKEVNHS
uniref:Uncharacterized protein n=1 Tax=Fagus sylvatica TaxID=28930 RepID=A0A2N9FSF1_FAGSY